MPARRCIARTRCTRCEKLGPVLVQYFGMGEVTGNITVLPPSCTVSTMRKCRLEAAAFRAPAWTSTILDDAGRHQPAGTTGEICVRGPGVFAGYHDNPEATEKATAHGWFHTGDLGHMDARGFVYITGRASDMYISGGSNVYPREIEEVLLLIPPSPRPASSACRTKNGARPASPCWCLNARHDRHSGETMRRISKAGSPATNVRAVFVVWPELPKSGYGKVVKRDVKRLLEDM